ncbi:MAG: Hsp70 family protein [Bacteroidales bacterium]|nr:Hsp70 family protein [Bacteroidales bacterium]
MAKIFGIDLGTTYSCIAYVDEFGKPVVVNNQDSSPVTPSVVAFEEGGNVIVGEAAKEVLQTDPINVCSKIKREMGKRDFSYSAFGTDYSPEVISSIILKKIAKDASEVDGEEVKDVVITCPAYFGMEEREATKNAGKLAGLNVLAILNEPTAAAISYGLKVEEPQTVLVYDLGGGTFDITIIKVENNTIHVVSTGGNHELGGKDWDDVLRNYVIEQYCQATSENASDIEDDIEVMGDLELKCEKAKKQLTQKDKATIKVQTEKVEVTKEKFEELTASLLESTIQLTHETMDNAKGKNVDKYDKILLVGGSSRMPQVERRLKQEFPDIPIEFCDPDQSVAKGAASYGMNLAAFGTINEGDNEEDAVKPNEELQKNPMFQMKGSASPQQINVVNVLSRSVAMEFADGIFNLVSRDTEIPVTTSVDAGTEVANQSNVAIRIFENLVHGDNAKVEEGQCKLLAEDTLPLNPGLPKGSPIKIDVNITATGLLTIDVTDASDNGKSRRVEIELKNALTEKQMEEEKSKLSRLSID